MQKYSYYACYFLKPNAKNQIICNGVVDDYELNAGDPYTVLLLATYVTDTKKSMAKYMIESGSVKMYKLTREEFEADYRLTTGDLTAGLPQLAQLQPQPVFHLVQRKVVH